ncbi:MAG: hypothetical protein U0W24_16360 [Bacteroidales bacterium]
MTYTIKITDDQTAEAKSLLRFLKSLSETKEYSFLIIEKEYGEELSENLIEELNVRYNHFLKNKNTYKSWDEIKDKYLAE